MAAQLPAIVSCSLTFGTSEYELMIEKELVKLTPRVREKVAVFLHTYPDLAIDAIRELVDFLASIEAIHMSDLDQLLAPIEEFDATKRIKGFFAMVIHFLPEEEDVVLKSAIEFMRARNEWCERELLTTGLELLTLFPDAAPPLFLREKLLRMCTHLEETYDLSLLVVPDAKLPEASVISVTPLDSCERLPCKTLGKHRAEVLIALSDAHEFKATHHNLCMGYHLRVLASFVSLMDDNCTDLSPFILTSVSSLLRHLFLSRLEEYDSSLDLYELAQKAEIDLHDDEETLLSYMRHQGFITGYPHVSSQGEEMGPFLRKTVEGRWFHSAHIVMIDQALAILSRVLSLEKIVLEPPKFEEQKKRPRIPELLELGQSRFAHLLPLAQDMSALFEYLLCLKAELLYVDILKLPALIYSAQLVLYQLVNGFNRASLACATEGRLPPSGAYLNTILPCYPHWSPSVEFIALLNANEVLAPNFELVAPFDLIERMREKGEEEHPDLTKIRAYLNARLLADVGVRHPRQFRTGEDLLYQGRVISADDLRKAKAILIEIISEVCEYAHTLTSKPESAIKV